jgi:integration host factor subunit alpha
MEMMGRLDRASGLSTDDNFTAKLPSAPTGDFKRISAPVRAAHVADDGGPTLTKAELAELVFEHVGLNKREAKDMVDAFFDEVSNALERGESVKLSGFGNFQLRDATGKAAHMQNPDAYGRRAQKKMSRSPIM